MAQGDDTRHRVRAENHQPEGLRLMSSHVQFPEPSEAKTAMSTTFTHLRTPATSLQRAGEVRRSMKEQQDCCRKSRPQRGSCARLASDSRAISGLSSQSRRPFQMSLVEGRCQSCTRSFGTRPHDRKALEHPPAIPGTGAPAHCGDPRPARLGPCVPVQVYAGPAGAILGPLVAKAWAMA